MNSVLPPVAPASALPCVVRAEQLNAGCQCASVDRAHLEAELERVSPGFHQEVMAGRPHLFADSMVFVSAAHLARMAELVRAIDRVVALPAFREHVLAWAPANAHHDPGTPGVFLGYDFHVGAGFENTGPQLIEINTNAGGGMFNALLARAQKACCPDVAMFLTGALGAGSAEQVFLDMFEQEWQAWQQMRRLTSADLRRLPASVAIVDIDPAQQYLHPEFVLFERMFRAAGIDVRICDPAELNFRDGRLWHGECAIDLVYNRLTDFSLDEPASAALRDAYLADAALITPHPRAHALYADKRNLVALTDDVLLAQWGVDAATRATLCGAIPRTELVTRERGDELWQRRRSLFFKPAAGYGSRAAYRGDKITRGVFEDVLAGDYIAQALVPPSLRTVDVGGKNVDLKLDLRNYVYAGEVQLVAARLWQGQTTNFRTPGGGFAPVLTVPADAVRQDACA